jgi:uncharacterized integral membrane protein
LPLGDNQSLKTSGKVFMMKKNKGIYALIGFLLAGTGLLSIVLSLVGVQLAFLKWQSMLPSPFGFLLKVVMIVVGMVIMYLALTDPDREEFME